MIIIPVSRQPDWRRPPLVTLLLILINVLVFFGLQSRDDDNMRKAYAYYAKSILIETELPRYVKHLEDAGETEKAEGASDALSRKGWFLVLGMMEGDAAFMERLRDGKIVRKNEANYTEWRRQRDEFDRLRRNTIIERFAFKSAQPTFAGVIGHMFLHGSFDHLLGNMAFLFLVGYMVEEALGKWRYLLFYLLSGIGSCALYALVGTPTMIPGIGASGAISGVMAMYVTLYGMRRIRFFYWILIYFDFFRAPAIIILPFWIAKELFQYLSDHGSMVNYLAHLGGFITGAALIGLARLAGKKQVAVPEQEIPVDPRAAPLARIDKLLNALRLDEARRELRRLADLYPRDPAIVNRYYQIARHVPANDDYHHAAALVFALPDNHPANNELIYETFVEYLKLAKPMVRFSVRQLIVLIRRLARMGHAVDAERLTRVLARRSPQQKELPGLLLLVAEAFRHGGDSSMHGAMLDRLRQDFPDSKEARVAFASV
ncbi:MAG: rhomboid family intramembrane serine protease [Candidatus Accumulibacter sp.]|jgi:membrane associated rhomboid family serine protease|nr:rhomboid family intramembrane serine protease [Accumulibacter sp.]